MMPFGADNDVGVSVHHRISQHCLLSILAHHHDLSGLKDVYSLQTTVRLELMCCTKPLQYP